MLAACVVSSELKDMELIKNCKTELISFQENFSIYLSLKRVKLLWKKLDPHGEVGFLLVVSSLQAYQIKRKDSMSDNSWTSVTLEWFQSYLYTDLIYFQKEILGQQL